MTKENEKDARAPDGVEGNDGEARQGKVKRGKTRDAFAFRDFQLFDFVSNLQYSSGIAALATPIVYNDKVVNFEYSIPKVYDTIFDSAGVKSAAYWSEVKNNVEKFEAKLSGFQKKMQRHIARLESRIKYLKGEQLELWLKDMKKIKEEVPCYGNKKSRLACLLDEYLFLSDYVQSQITFLNNVKSGLERRLKPLNMFSQRLYLARRRRFLTQSQLATKLGLSRAGYAPYELGKRDPTLTMLINISKVLEVSIEWLCGLKD